jgi:hypothetical protein
VSRLSNKALQLRVGARAVHATLSAGWPRRKVIARAIEMVGTAGEPTSPPPRADAQAVAIGEALTSLAASAPLAGARLSVELADARTHYDLVDGDFGASSERELRTIASACAAELLGEASSSHILRWQVQPGQGHLLICAIEARVIESVVDTARRFALKLVSLEPEFSAQWNRHAGMLPRGNGVFGVTCGAHATVACVLRGGITALSSGAWADAATSVRSERGARTALDIRVDRLLAGKGVDSRRVGRYVLVAPDVSARALSTRWTVVQRHGAAA